LTLFELLKHILLFNEENKPDAATEEFLKRTKHCIAQIYNKHIKLVYYRHLTLEDFEGFVKGWMFDKKKLNMLYARYEKEDAKGQVSDKNEFVLRYFYRILDSGFFDWRRETNPEFQKDITIMDISLADRIVKPDELTAKEYFEFIDKHMDIIVSMMHKLPPEKRIPLWLKRIIRTENLPQEDIKWLADLHNCSTEEIEQRIYKGMDLSMKSPLFAMSLTNIGELMKESANTMSQRIARAKDEIRDMVRERQNEVDANEH